MMTLLCSRLSIFLLFYILCMYASSNVYVLHFWVGGYCFVHGFKLIYVPAPFSLYIYIDSSLWRQIKFNQNLKEHISQFCFFLLIIKLKLKKINKIPREIATINLHIIKMKIIRNPIQQIKNYIKTIMIFSMI